MRRSQLCFPTFPVQQVANRIIYLRKITRIDQHLFMSALLAKKSLSLEEKNLVEQVYQGLSSGWIKVVE
jgi:predicted nucleic acid-binding protein